MQTLTKSEAHAEVLRRWREKPINERKTYAQAEWFATELADLMDFATLGRKQHIIKGWLVRELDGLVSPLGRPVSGSGKFPTASATPAGR